MLPSDWCRWENSSTAEGLLRSWTPPLNISVPWWPHESCDKLCKQAELLLLLLLISLWKSIMFKEREAKTWSSSSLKRCGSCVVYTSDALTVKADQQLTSSWLCICLHVATVTASLSPPSSSVRTREWARPQATCSTLVCWGWTRGRATGDGSNTKS